MGSIRQCSCFVTTVERGFTAKSLISCPWRVKASCMPCDSPPAPQNRSTTIFFFFICASLFLSNSSTKLDKDHYENQSCEHSDHYRGCSRTGKVSVIDIISYLANRCRCCSQDNADYIVARKKVAENHRNAADKKASDTAKQLPFACSCHSSLSCFRL